VSQPPITVYAAGHGSRSTQDLLALLRETQIRTLVDVRARPGSSRHPQFEMEALRATLDAAGIVYHWGGRQLGGLRSVGPASRHSGLPEDLRGYADHMETEAFRRGAAQLLHLAATSSTVMLCAERLPAHCHRSLIADYLTVQGARVVHLIEPGMQVPHRLSPTVRVEGHTLVYEGGFERTLRLDS
jgi:uncharacterized protein (DUF488 family)